LQLGWVYDYGVNVTKDYTEAMVWFRKASDQGLPFAKTSVGVLYLSGLGVNKSSEKAMEWFREGAAAGDLWGATWVGYMTHYGFGIPKDEEEGLKLLRAAADRGAGRAASLLGIHLGENKKDFATAIDWFKKGAAGGDTWAMVRLGEIYLKGREGIAPNQTEALQWFARGAETEDPYALFALGDLYWKGDGVAKDKAEAMRWYKHAAANGHQWARFFVATRYEATGLETVTVGTGFQARGTEQCPWESFLARNATVGGVTVWPVETDELLKVKTGDPKDVLLDAQRADFWNDRVNPSSRTLPDGTQIWWAYGMHMQVAPKFKAIARKNGVLYLGSATYKAGDRNEENRLLDCFIAVLPSLTRVAPGAQFTDPVSGEKVDFPKPLSPGRFDRDKGEFNAFAFHLNITAGALRYPIRDLDMAVAMVEAMVEREKSKPSAHQQLDFANGKAVWAEATGGRVVLYGVVSRGGRYFYAYMDSRHNRPVSQEERQAFLAVLQNIRP
jgi:TPR repeat protein